MAYDRYEEELKRMDERIKSIQEALDEKTALLKAGLKRVFVGKLWTQINEEKLQAFVGRPYLIRPKERDEYEICVPSMINMYIGALEFCDEAWNVFRVNKFMSWVYDIPEVLKDELGFIKEAVEIEFDAAGKIRIDEAKKKGFMEKFRGKIRQTPQGLYALKPRQFSLIIDLLQEGYRPYVKRPVAKEDLTDFEPIALRPWQQEAATKFEQIGHVGLFFPWGAGKSAFGRYYCGRLKGNKLVIVPTKSLIESWWKQLVSELKPIIIKWHPLSHRMIETKHGNVYLRTYNVGQDDMLWRKEWILVVWDEVHHLPADTFSTLASIPNRYSIGLSGSPFREDGRSEYIYALTGYPIGTNWEEFYKLKIVNIPKCVVQITNDKLSTLKMLLSKLHGRICVQCDSISKGTDLGKKLGIPFVHGETRKRLEAIENKEVFVISRVGDEGISLPDLNYTIEFDFLYASRMQESQRIGRLFHSFEGSTHYILMTPQEYNSYHKRLLAIRERGIQIQIEK